MAGHWTQADKVEVIMPFTKHIEYGPDKLPAEVASNDGTPLKAAWTGVIMYGPLAMTGTGTTTWHQATLSLDPKLDQLKPTTEKGNLFTLKFGNKIFEPDYYRNHNSTHYYRLQFAGINDKNHTQKNKSQAIAELRSLIAIATERVEEQTRWNSLTKKVPDYAPWAPHGFQRLGDAISAAQKLMETDQKNIKENDLESVTATLNKAINTMRPGNLAEIEDLQPLTALLRRQWHQRYDQRSRRQTAQGDRIAN